MNALVVHYSRTGTTKKVAEKLAFLLKCVSEEIHDTTNRKGKLGWLRARAPCQPLSEPTAHNLKSVLIE